MSNIESIIGVLLVIAVLLFGYRIKRIALAIVAFVVGYHLANQYIPSLVEGEFLQTILPLACGLLLALISSSIENVAIFIATAITTYSIAGNYVNTGTWAGIGIAIAIAVIIGSIAVAIKKPAIIVITAVAAAHIISLAVLNFTGLAVHPYYMVIVAIVATAGALFQFKNTKGLD